MWFSFSTCFQQLRLVSHSTSQYLHVQNKECEQFRFVSKQRAFFVSLTSLTRTNYLSILSRVFLLLKNDRISEQVQAPCKYVHTRLNTGIKKCFFYLSCCSKFSHVGISVTCSSVSTANNTSFNNLERKYVLNLKLLSQSCFVQE
jgi:hypothetical protein